MIQHAFTNGSFHPSSVLCISQVKETCDSALITAFPPLHCLWFMLQSFKGQAAECTCFCISKGRADNRDRASSEYPAHSGGQGTQTRTDRMGNARRG